jgi:hypothetical protein
LGAANETAITSVFKINLEQADSLKALHILWKTDKQRMLMLNLLWVLALCRSWFNADVSDEETV